MNTSDLMAALEIARRQLAHMEDRLTLLMPNRHRRDFSDANQRELETLWDRKYWIIKTLHRNPESLREKIDELIKEIQAFETGRRGISLILEIKRGNLPPSYMEGWPHLDDIDSPIVKVTTEEK